MQVDIAHFTSDCYPRVLADPAGSPDPDLLLPFRIWTAERGVRVVSSRLDVDVDGRSWSTRARVRRIHPGFANWLREQMQRQSTFGFDHLPYYLDMDAAMASGQAQFLEVRLPQVPAGAAVRYHLEVTLRGTGGDQEERSAAYATWAVPPDFTREDIRRIFIPRPGAAEDAWVLYHRRRGGSDEFRVDVVDLAIGGGTADLVVQVGDHVLDLGRSDPGALPLVDVSADSIAFAVPHEGGALPAVTVRYRHGESVPVDLADRVGIGSARLMFVNFAIQGLNDLFAGADDDYSPPRTYAQVTMRDPAASFSSRPGSTETTTGDGYGYTLDAHRRYRLPQMWAMNGGLLGLLAHDCPDELQRMRKDVADGLLVPVVTGFGAHRLPYYSETTNTDSIRLGSEALVEILGETRPVYYPDSRITTSTDNVVKALQRNDMSYVVVDAGPGETNDSTSTVVRNPQPAMGSETGGRWHNWQYLWRDRISGLKVVFIDPEMKDRLLRGPSPDVLRDADRGTVAVELRRKFIELAAQPELRRRNLVVYSDDADKASGNGWFDGVYGTGPALPFNHQYQAALSWLAAHPWVQVLTTDDLVEDDVVGDLDLVRASDPYISRWLLPTSPPLAGKDFGLAFDTWYAAWSAVRPAWLGETLGQISDRAERAVELWPDTYRNGLYDLAVLYLSMSLHESQWSKRARIDAFRPGCTDPENFVVAESIQLRNAHVYLNASVWAWWTQQPAAAGEPVAYRDSGPVVAAVAELDADHAPWRRPTAAGLQWDHDPLANIVLYNREALVVIDRNGGRITHLFSMVEGRPVSVSGTMKAYQFLDMDWPSDSGTECEGIVLQNTVWTPNHAYVACDVDPSRCTTGASPAGDDVFDFYYPDNFNAYEADGASGLPEVRLTYGEGEPLEQAPETMADLDARLDEDRQAKLAGRAGVVLHDTEAFGRFGKTIRLDGRTVHVSYQGTLAEHRVANEFCVDLWATAMQGRRQTHRVAPDGRSAEVAHVEGKLAVRIELGSGCEFSAATTAEVDAGTVESLRVHRVMTDDLEIIAPTGGEFDYRIVLP